VKSEGAGTSSISTTNTNVQGPLLVAGTSGAMLQFTGSGNLTVPGAISIDPGNTLKLTQSGTGTISGGVTGGSLSKLWFEGGTNNVTTNPVDVQTLQGTGGTSTVSAPST
jgi:hypothetical protein